jgi:hypothetical protein
MSIALHRGCMYSSNGKRWPFQDAMRFLGRQQTADIRLGAAICLTGHCTAFPTENSQQSLNPDRPHTSIECPVADETNQCCPVQHFGSMILLFRLKNCCLAVIRASSFIAIQCVGKKTEHLSLIMCPPIVLRAVMRDLDWFRLVEEKRSTKFAMPSYLQLL